MGQTITGEAALFEKAFGEGVTPAMQQRWLVRYLEAIRDRRIARLLAFITAASRQAQRLEHDGSGWYGEHVRWAIARLCRLGYTFPECDPLLVPVRLDERRAA